MGNIQVKIVGMHFRPPAKWILANLPSGSDVWLEQEPDNQWDSKAIAAYVMVGDIPEEKMAELVPICENCGYDLVEARESCYSFHVGYLPNSDGKLGKPVGNREIRETFGVEFTTQGGIFGKLRFDEKDQPMVELAV